MQGGFSRIPLPKEKFSFLFALFLMGRHIFVSSTFGLLTVLLTSRCEVLSFYAKSSHVACRLIFEICRLSCCQLCTVAVLYLAYRDRRFYTTGSYLQPVYLQVIPMFILGFHIPRYLSIVLFARSSTGYDRILRFFYFYLFIYFLINCVEHNKRDKITV